EAGEPPVDGAPEAEDPPLADEPPADEPPLAAGLPPRPEVLDLPPVPPSGGGGSSEPQATWHPMRRARVEAREANDDDPMAARSDLTERRPATNPYDRVFQHAPSPSSTKLQSEQSTRLLAKRGQSEVLVFLRARATDGAFARDTAPTRRHARPAAL